MQDMRPSIVGLCLINFMSSLCISYKFHVFYRLSGCFSLVVWTTGEAHLLEISELKLPQARKRCGAGVLEEQGTFCKEKHSNPGGTKKRICLARCLRCLRQAGTRHQSKLSLDILAVKHGVNS